MSRKIFNSLKFQIFFFITINVLVWFIISESMMEYLWTLEDKGKIVVTNAGFTLLVIIQALLFIIINIPFIIFLIRHIDKPVQKILKALKRIKEEDFSEKIEFNSKNEFDVIKDEVNLMSRELEASKKLRENLNEQRNMLFANMAHDLKTPITTIQSYTKALSDGIIDSPQKEKEYIDTIHTKSIIMNDLIDRLFEYVKLNSDANVLHTEKADVAELLRNCIASIYSEYEDHDIQLNIEIPEKAIILDIDRIEIGRVFTNLLINILNHNDNGIRVLIKMEETGKTIIADSGSSIPEKIETNLFQPFVKGDSSRKSGKGSGLGLSLSKLVMLKHSGNLEYVKNYNNYTKAFIVTFKNN
ncbi:MAG: HAMP domain-containing histidine kinase [Treponema sp.]|nr:HAMP domain-containing histidine kinase [Treponema sp.]